MVGFYAFLFHRSNYGAGFVRYYFSEYMGLKLNAQLYPSLTIKYKNIMGLIDFRHLHSRPTFRAGGMLSPLCIFTRDIY
jgi:hypothetical protein